MLKQSRMTTEGGFRSLGVIELPVDEERLIFKKTKTSPIGNLVQRKCVNPFEKIEGETAFTSAGAGYEYAGSLVRAAKALEEGAWIYLRDVDFGKEELMYFCATVKGTGRLELRLDNLLAAPAACLEFDNTEYQNVYMELQQQIIGVHDVYLVMSQEGICLDCWSVK
jgi:arabinoxylan arabinofuranohydrolase